jgi:hypothetical protein
MNWLLLDSRMLAAVAYEEQKQILYLRFRKTGDVYRYFEFQAADYQAFLNADSRGRFFLAHIRDRFRYERLARLHAA